MVIKIENLRQAIRDEESHLIADITSDGIKQAVTFTRYSTDPSLAECRPCGEPFLVMMLMHAMKHGEDLAIDGEVDPVLLHELQGTVQQVLRLQFKELQQITIHASSRKHHEPARRAEHVATGFSGGVDSMQLLDRGIFRRDIPKDLCVTLLMHHDVGSVAQRKQHEVNKVHARTWADKLGISFAGASCDMSEFYTGFSFIQSHTMRTVAASLSLSPLFRRYLFASGTEIQVGLPGICSRIIDRANPVLLPLLSTRHNEFRQFGGEFTRLDKILQVLMNDTLLPGINLCARMDHDNSMKLNCGRCFKCFPFLLVAEATGKLPYLSGNFDIDSFQRFKARSYFNFFYDAIGPKKQENNRQVAEFRRNIPGVSPAWLALLMHLVPPPRSKPSPATESFYRNNGELS